MNKGLNYYLRNKEKFNKWTFLLAYAATVWLMSAAQLRIFYSNGLYGTPEGNFFIAGFAVSVTMAYWCHYKAMVADPGVIKPKTDAQLVDKPEQICRRCSAFRHHD